MTTIHQFIPSFAPRSAVGNHTLQVRNVLRDLGVHSEVFVGEAKREVEGISTPFHDYAGSGDPRTWLLYQSSTGSPMVDFLLQRPEPKLVDYHNITPAALFAPWEPHVGVELRAGRRQLADLAPVTELGLADSAYNRDELDRLGYRATAVVPILLDLESFGHAPPAAVDRLRASAGATWLFVGRLSPNKAQHDLMKALAAYRRAYDPGARLRLVGGSSSHAYSTALERFRSELGLEEAVEFVGEVSDSDLAAHYRAADVFVCASDHEGFCVPLLEAMHHRVPIVAYASTAVPETLGEGGLLLDSKAPVTLAAAVQRVLTDAPLREALLAAGTARLAQVHPDVTRRRLTDVLAPLLQ